jgi:DNA-binding response OmpR family regulator
MAHGESSSIYNDLKKLQEDYDRLVHAYGRLRWAIDGATSEHEVVFNLSPLRARIVTLFATGRVFSVEQLIVAAWQSDASNSTFYSVISQMKRDLPWFKVRNLKCGTREGALYQMEKESVEYVKRRVEEAQR